MVWTQEYYMPRLDYLSWMTHCLTWGPRHTECARHVPLTPKRRHWTDLSSIDTGIPLIHSSDVKSSLSATCSTSEGCVPYYRKPSWISRLYKNPTKITSLEWADLLNYRRSTASGRNREQLSYRLVDLCVCCPRRFRRVALWIQGN